MGRARYQRAAGCAAARPGSRNGYCDSTIEESIAMGCRGFVVCGGAGVLRPNVALGHLILSGISLLSSPEDVKPDETSAV